MSKQCLNCGLALPDNANFCRGCGSSEFKSFNNEMPPTAPIVNSDFQSPQAQYSPPPPVNTQPPKKNKTGLIIGIIAAVIIVSVIAGIAVFSSFEDNKKDSENIKTTTTTTSSTYEDTGTTAETSTTNPTHDDTDVSLSTDIATSASTSSSSNEKPSANNTKPSHGNTKPSTNPTKPIPSKPSLNPDSSEDDLLEEGMTTTKTTLCEDIIGNSIKDKKFTISMVMIADGEKIPTTISMNGNDLATKINVSGMDARMIIKDGKTYMVMEATKTYFEMEDESFTSDDLAFDIDASGAYIGTTTVKDGGKTYTCETYKTPEGATVKYYFLGNKWARYEIIEGSNVTVLEITDFRASTDASLFNLNGYTKMDLESMM